MAVLLLLTHCLKPALLTRALVMLMVISRQVCLFLALVNREKAGDANGIEVNTI